MVGGKQPELGQLKKIYNNYKTLKIKLHEYVPLFQAGNRFGRGDIQSI